MTNEAHDSQGFENTADILRPALESYDLKMVIFTIVLILLGLFFNLIIFYVFWGMRKSASAMIFLNLAAVDLLLTCFVMPYSITTLLNRDGDSLPLRTTDGTSPSHHIFCAISGSLFEISVFCTLGFVLLASLDRFFGVFYPIKHRKHFQRTNLIKMIISVWTISPIIVIIYVSLWIILSPTSLTFSNQNIFPVCVGQYWFKEENHIIGNVPSYITVTFLTILIIIIVIVNLAVLKQLFRKKPKPLATLQPASQCRTRRNNTTIRIPPIVVQLDGTSTSGAALDKAKEELRRLSLAEQAVKKSERIFQTDSTGDIIGINIKAIMKLYIVASRSSQVFQSYSSCKESISAETLSQPSSQSDEMVDVQSTEPVGKTEVLVSILDGAGDSEKDFTDDEEIEEHTELDGPPLCSDCEDVDIKSDCHSGDLKSVEDDDIDYEVVWKVIKFVVTLKRNSRKRQSSDLVRCSSDSDLSILQENGERSTMEHTVTNPARKYSEMQSTKTPKPSFPYEVPNLHAKDVECPTMDEIQEMVTDGELSPLVRRYKMKTPDLATLKKIVLKNRRKISLRNSTSSLLSISSFGGIKGLQKPRTQEDIDSITEVVKEREAASFSWGTLAAIAKMKNKLMRTKEVLVDDAQTKTELIPFPEVVKDGVVRQTSLKTIYEEDVKSEGSVSNLLGVPPHYSHITPFSLSEQKCSPVEIEGNGTIKFEPARSQRRRQGTNITPSNGDITAPPCSNTVEQQDTVPIMRQRRQESSAHKISRSSMNISGVAQMVYNFNKQAQKKKKEIRAAKTIIILVFYYIFTLLLFIVAFYYVTMMEESEKPGLPYWLTFYSYILYLNAVLNPVIHFWRNAKVRTTVLQLICPNKVNEAVRRYKLRGGF